MGRQSFVILTALVLGACTSNSSAPSPVTTVKIEGYKQDYDSLMIGH
jgi:hypothetical protein